MTNDSNGVAAGILQTLRGFRRLKGHTAVPQFVAAVRARDQQIGLVGDVDNVPWSSTELPFKRRDISAYSIWEARRANGFRAGNTMSRRIVFLALVIASLSAANTKAQDLVAPKPTQKSGISSFLTLHDQSFLFEITFPSDWHTKQSSSNSSFFRLKGSSPKNDTFVDVYSGALENGSVDLTRLVDSAKTVFDFLGNETARKKVGSARYEVSYDNKNKYAEYSKVLYLAKENHYYVLIAYARKSDLSASEDVISSFVVKAPFSWTTIVFLVGTGSLLLHLLVPSGFLLYVPVSIFREEGPKGLVDIVGGRRWFMLGLPLWLGLFYLVFYMLDYHVARTIASGYLSHGVDGVISELLDFGPRAFDVTGEVVSECLAELCGVGFWPGGLAGVVLSTIMSVVVNVFEIRFVLKRLVKVADLES